MCGAGGGGSASLRLSRLRAIGGEEVQRATRPHHVQNKATAKEEQAWVGWQCVESLPHPSNRTTVWNQGNTNRANRGVCALQLEKFLGGKRRGIGEKV